MRLHLASISVCSLLFLGIVSPAAQSRPPLLLAQANSPKAIAQSVNKISAAVTVRIDAQSGGNGSGVIVGRQGQTYTVLTAEHVIGNVDQYEPVSYTHLTLPTTSRV